MNTRLVSFILSFLVAASPAFAEPVEKKYLGSWSDGRAFELKLELGILTFGSNGNPSETLKYSDVTPEGTALYHLEISDPKKGSYFSKFLSCAIARTGDKNEMTMTQYKSLSDLKANKDPQGTDRWFRDGETDEGEIEFFTGTLQVGESQSVILYRGDVSGDYAAVCFSNKSEAGAMILAACKDGEKCKVTGKIDYESGCKVPGLEADLSASGAIVSVAAVENLSQKTAGKKEEADAVVMADKLVKSLYEAHARDESPFFQTENRARVDLYFSKDFADLIWKDAVEAGGEVGALGFDPLYNAQDTEITAFAIGKPEAGDGFTTVAVTFKNFGEKETFRYLLAQDSKQNWKISDIRYTNGDMLKGIIQTALKQE